MPGVRVCVGASATDVVTCVNIVRNCGRLLACVYVGLSADARGGWAINVMRCTPNARRPEPGCAYQRRRRRRRRRRRLCWVKKPKRSAEEKITCTLLVAATATVRRYGRVLKMPRLHYAHSICRVKWSLQSVVSAARRCVFATRVAFARHCRFVIQNVYFCILLSMILFILVNIDRSRFTFPYVIHIFSASFRTRLFQ